MSSQFSHSITKQKINPRTFHKNWYVKFNDPTHQQALWLRFTVLSSNNGFKRISETWAIFFQKKSNRETRKIAVKQTHDIQAFLASDSTHIRIGNCELSAQGSTGTISSKGQSIQWDLSLLPARENSIHFVPEILSKTRLVTHSVVTLCEELLVSGTIRVNDEVFTIKEAPGMQGYLDGTRNRHSWVWGHCNSFLNEQGKLSPFLFEGLSYRTQLGPFTGPRLSSFYFLYKNQHYHFNSLREAIYIKSRQSLNDWAFEADRDDLSFRGKINSEHKNFAGLTYEDTNGSLLYCSNSELANMTIHIYRKGKLESTFTSEGTAGFEIVSREKNPYVPLIL